MKLIVFVVVGPRGPAGCAKQIQNIRARFATLYPKDASPTMAPILSIV